MELVRDGLIILTINLAVIFVLHFRQKRSLNRYLKHLKSEVQELEDLVAAIIEEFEDIAVQKDKNMQDNSINPELEPVVNHSPQSLKTESDTISNEVPFPKDINLDKPVTSEPGDYSEPFSLTGKQPGRLEPNLDNINDPRHRRIVELQKQGLAVEEIARQLGTGRGEVQLILGLYRRS